MLPPHYYCDIPQAGGKISRALRARSVNIRVQSSPNLEVSGR